MQQETFNPQRLQHFGPADTQNDLLAQPLLEIAGVKPRRYAAIPGIIQLDIGVH